MSKTVLVTGSSKGLGRSLALTFARNNYNVIIHGRNRKRLEEVEQGIKEWNVECTVVTGHLSESRTIEKLAFAGKRRIDVFINNAGVYLKKYLVDFTDVEIREMMEVNLIAPMLLTKKMFYVFGQSMERGTIVNINSLAGKNPAKEETIYCASKHGLRGFSSSLQWLSSRKNVGIIDVYLGAMKTGMTKDRESYDKLIDPDEAANAIFALIQNYKTLKITEVHIVRKNH